MKKLLLASTALVGFAGAAAAEVNLTGYAEIGVFGGNKGTETQFHSDFDVTFALSGESDGGIAFGATVDLDEIGDDCTGRNYEAFTGVDLNGDGDLADGANVCVGGDPISNTGRGSGVEEASVFVSGAFGKVTLGDTDGALDWAGAEIYMGTALTDDHSTHAGAYWFTGLDGIYDGQVMRYEYSFGEFAIAGSLEMDDVGSGDPVYGVGVKWAGEYSGILMNAGLGYQTSDTNIGNYEAIAVSAGADFSNGISVRLGYSHLNSPVSVQTDGNWYGIGVGYQMDALLVQANYGAYDLDVPGLDDPSGFGLVANYDLGGGAVAMVGYGHSEDGVSYNGNGDDTWSAGLGLSF